MISDSQQWKSLIIVMNIWWGINKTAYRTDITQYALYIVLFQLPIHHISYHLYQTASHLVISCSVRTHIQHCTYPPRGNHAESMCSRQTDKWHHYCDSYCQYNEYNGVYWSKLKFKELLLAIQKYITFARDTKIPLTSKKAHNKSSNSLLWLEILCQMLCSSWIWWRVDG